MKNVYYKKNCIIKHLLPPRFILLLLTRCPFWIVFKKFKFISRVSMKGFDVLLGGYRCSLLGLLWLPWIRLELRLRMDCLDLRNKHIPTAWFSYWFSKFERNKSTDMQSSHKFIFIAIFHIFLDIKIHWKLLNHKSISMPQEDHCFKCKKTFTNPFKVISTTRKSHDDFLTDGHPRCNENIISMKTFLPFIRITKKKLFFIHGWIFMLSNAEKYYTELPMDVQEMEKYLKSNKFL
jgi:hypothetical protein